MWLIFVVAFSLGFALRHVLAMGYNAAVERLLLEYMKALLLTRAQAQGKDLLAMSKAEYDKYVDETCAPFVTRQARKRA